MKYSKIKSPYIKKQLQNTIWKNHNYIDDLILLHKYMIKGIHSWISANIFSDLTFKYQKEYLKLIEEDIKLNPSEKRVKMYSKYIHDMELRNKQKIQWIKEDFRKDNLLKKDWIKSGGAM